MTQSQTKDIQQQQQQHQPQTQSQHQQHKSSTNNTVTPPPVIPRMWTCTKCSYAYNPLWVEQCDICESYRTPPSLTQPSLITVMKDGIATTSSSCQHNEQGIGKESSGGSGKFPPSKSTHAFDEVPSIVEVPMATFEQDLDDDYQFLSGEITCTII